MFTCLIDDRKNFGFCYSRVALIFSGAIISLCDFGKLKISLAVKYLKMDGGFSSDNFENLAGLSKVSFLDSNNSQLLQAMHRQGPLGGLNIFPLGFVFQERVAV